MASFNKFIGMGNLTRDPELRHTPNGAAVCDLGVALNRVWHTKEGEKREDVTFIDVTVWNKQAENCVQYLGKGCSVHIEGFLKQETWDDKTTGEKRSKIKVEAESVKFITFKDRDGDGGGRDQSPRRESAPSRSAPQTRQPAPASAPSRGGAPMPHPPMDDDDIPF